LALLVARVRANHAHDAIAPDDLAVAANLLDRSQYFHGRSSSFVRLFRAEGDPRAGEVIRGDFHRHLVARQYLDVMHPHLPGDMPQDHMPVFQLDAERGVGEHFDNLPLHLDRFFFGSQRVGSPPLKLALRSRLSYCCDIRYACTWVMKSIVTTTMISSDVPPK